VHKIQQYLTIDRQTDLMAASTISCPSIKDLFTIIVHS